MSAQQKATANRIRRCRQDAGDVQLAWDILNLQGVGFVPTIEEFLEIVNDLLAEVDPENWDSIPAGSLRTRLMNAVQGPLIRRRQRDFDQGAIHKIFHAIHTIADFQNEHWIIRPWERNFQLPFVDLGDRPPNAPPWGNIASPFATEAAFNAYAAGIPAAYDADVVRTQLAPTANEVRQSMYVAARSWADDDHYVLNYPHGGNRAVAILPGVAWPQIPVSGDGNCHWYAMAEALSFKPPLRIGPTEVVNPWRQDQDVQEPWVNRTVAPFRMFAELKANIRYYFMSVIQNPRHPRYKMYNVLQHQSCRRSGTYGETSIIRMLHRNEPFPMVTKSLPYPLPDNNRDRFGFFQILADYYNIEVVLFREPPVQGQACPTSVRGVCAPGRRQIFIFFDGERHSTAARPPNNLPNGRFPTDIGLGHIPLTDRCDSMPWHPAVLGNADLPGEIAAKWRYPMVVAPQSEVDYVLTNRDFPEPMPFIEPLHRCNLWRNGNSLHKNLQLGPAGVLCSTGHPPYQQL